MRTLLAPAFLTLALCACSTLDPDQRVPEEHIVMVNYRGNPVDPTDDPWLGIGHYRQVGDDEYRAQLGRLIEHVEQYAKCIEGRAPARGRPGLTDLTRVQELAVDRLAEQREIARAEGLPEPRATPRARVIVFVHGGLNTQAGSVARAVELHTKVLADGAYPVFLNWQSSLVSSYWDHLFLVRFGEEKPWQAWLTAPFVIGADLLRAIGRSPMTLWNEIETALRTWRYDVTPTQRATRKLSAEVLASPEWRGRVELPEAESNSGGGVLVFARDVVLMLPHAVLGVLLDIGGTASWEQMHRRTTLMLEPEDDYRHGGAGVGEPAAVPRFLGELRALQDRLATEGIELQVDLIGHSMGCIISNLVLESGAARHANGVGADGAPSATDALPVFTNIVYMADADTVQKTERAVFGYMQRPEHARTRFFQLCLNDRSEVAETAGFWLAPKGSLLVWIDHFFAATPSMPDQRMGKLVNQLYALHRVPTGLRGRVHLKSFRYDSDEPRRNPTEHGEFTEGRFWREEFFTPRTPVDASSQ